MLPKEHMDDTHYADLRLNRNRIMAGIHSTQADDLLEKYRNPAKEKWADEMQRIAKLDASETDPDNAILFIGSSSIRLWKDIASDLQPWPVISRGYGGAKFSDLAVWLHKLSSRTTFERSSSLWVNDVTGGDDDKTPEEVVKLFEHVVGTISQPQFSGPYLLA